MGFWSSPFRRRKTYAEELESRNDEMREFYAKVNRRLHDDLGYPLYDPMEVVPPLDIKDRIDWSFLEKDNRYREKKP